MNKWDPIRGKLAIDIKDERIAAELSEQGDSQCNTFQRGDVLFGKLRPYLAKAWVAQFDGRCSTEILVMTPDNFEADYLICVLLSKGFLAVINGSAFGSKMPRAEWSFIGNQKVPNPPLSEQRQIISFIKIATEKIEAIQLATERSITLLLERRAALITATVTGQSESSILKNISG